MKKKPLPPRRHPPRTRVGVVVMLALAVAAVLWLKPRSEAPDSNQALAVAPIAPVTSHGLPRLVDVGADACIPCKLMAPILDGLRREYAGRMDVVFIDVWKNPGAGRRYGVYMIPTQIFYDAAGRELARHQGYISKEDILETWRKLGVKLDAAAGGVTP